MRRLLAVVAVVAVPSLAAAQEPLTRALMNQFDGGSAWRAAARSAFSDSPAGGLSVVVSETGQSSCEVPEELLVAEAESILRRSGVSLRQGALNGAAVRIHLVSVESPSGRCAASLYMGLTIDRLQQVGSDDIFFGTIVVDHALLALHHPSSDHRSVLRESVNERITVWANQLVRHRPD